MMKYRSLLLLVVVGAAMAAPGESSRLPLEHRVHESQPLRVMETLDATVEAVINSRTVAAIDETAAKVASAFGEVVDDLGDFVVDGVRDLPQTIERVSESVGTAVQDGNERVVIVVKGIRRQAAEARNATASTADRVAQAFNSSQVATSFKELGERIATTVARIFGSIFQNMEKIDTAVADGIRRVSVSAMPPRDGAATDKKPEGVVEDAAQSENEIRTLV